MVIDCVGVSAPRENLFASFTILLFFPVLVIPRKKLTENNCVENISMYQKMNLRTTHAFPHSSFSSREGHEN